MVVNVRHHFADTRHLTILRLFDNSGGAANGNKQDVVNSAVQTIMKFVLKSQLSGAMGTGGGAAGGSGGGLGNLMSMASK